LIQYKAENIDPLLIKIEVSMDYSFGYEGGLQLPEPELWRTKNWQNFHLGIILKLKRSINFLSERLKNCPFFNPKRGLFSKNHHFNF
jgi:hypothetical protein